MNRQRRPGFGFLLGIASGVLVGWGIYNLMRTGSCSTPAGPGEVPCPPGTMRYVFALVGGIFLGVGSSVGGSGMGFFGIFGGIGAGAVAAGLSENGESWYFFFAACFLLTPVLGLAGAVYSGVRRSRAAHLMAEGIPATGTVLEIADTGVTINNNPRLRMRFRIEPNEGYPAPFEAEKVATVPRVALPRVGDKYPVWIDRDDNTTWMFATGADGSDPRSSPTLRRVIELARQGAGPALPPAPNVDIVGELNRLNELRMSGKISADEFAARTSDLISATPTA